MRRTLLTAFTAALLASSCERRHIVLDATPLLGNVAPPPANAQLRVLCSLDQGGTDPLAIEGAEASFVGVRATLAAVSSAALTKWAEASHRKGGWELRLEIFKDSAKVLGDHTVVELSTRATLTSGAGEAFATQTRDYCKEEASDPATAMYACMTHLTHDLERWIEGVPP